MADLEALAAVVRKHYGEDPDPMEGVPHEHREDAERTRALWEGAGRSDLATLARRVNPAVIPPWKHTLLARMLARRVIRETSPRLQHAAARALAVFLPNVLDPFRSLVQG